jgi:hypothetical protein
MLFMKKYIVFLSVILTEILFGTLNVYASSNSVAQLVNNAKGIYVGVVTDQHVFWNQTGRIIKTRYTFAVEETVKNELNYGDIFELVVLGGELDGVVQYNSLSIFLQTGARYLLLIQNPKAISPFAGGVNGVYQESSFAQHPSGLVKDIDSFAQWVGTVKDVYNTEAAKPVADPRTTGQKLDKEQNLPSKIFDPAELQPGFLDNGEQDIRIPEQQGSIRQPRYSYNRDQGAELQGGYIVVEPLSGGVFQNDTSPYDEYMLSKWNKYADIFRVSTSNGTWAFGNGVNEFVGFPSDTVLSQQGLGVWEDSTLGVTFYAGWPIEECQTFLGIEIRCYQSGTRHETDVALNPKIRWTSDVEYGTRNNNVYNVQQTLLHEFGHVWGLKHPWESQNVWWDSVMNYAPKQYRFPALHNDDTEAVRSAFSNRVVPLKDAAIFAWKTADDTSSNNPVYVPTTASPNKIKQGGSFALSSFLVENLGTETISGSLEIKVYLTPNRMDSTGQYYIYSGNYNNINIARFSRGEFYMSSVMVPYSIPPGQYYIKLYLVNNDAVTSNNTAWTVDGSTITVEEASVASLQNMADVVFNYVEVVYSNWFYPHKTSQTWGEYYYRHYSNGSYLLLWNGELWYKIEDSDWNNAGTVHSWYAYVAQ